MKIILFIIPLLFIGCASTVVTQMIKEPEIKFNQYEYFSINVEIDDVDLNEEIDDALIDLLKDTILRKIFEKKLAAKIIYSSSINPSKLLNINITLTDLNKVTAIDRFLVGGLSGQGIVGVKVECYDKDNSKLISEAVIMGKSSGGTAFAGTTSQAIEKASEEIANLVEKYF